MSSAGAVARPDRHPDGAQGALAYLSVVLGVTAIVLFPLFGLGLWPALPAIATGIASLALGARHGTHHSRIALAGVIAGLLPWLYLFGFAWTHLERLRGAGDLALLVVATLGAVVLAVLACSLFAAGRRRRRAGGDRP